MSEQLDESYVENLTWHEEHYDYSELYKAVNTLKEELRVPVILYYMEEFSVKEEEYTIWALMALLCLGLEIVLRHTLLKNIP